jgi:hypothetical protein
LIIQLEESVQKLRAMREDMKELAQALRISELLSEIGKTRLPRSVFSLTPSPSKKEIVSAGDSALRAAYKNLGLRLTLSRKVFTSQSLVTLHRPLPVMASFFPRRPVCSYTVTDAPQDNAVPAAIIPAAPPPITAIRG